MREKWGEGVQRGAGDTCQRQGSRKHPLGSHGATVIFFLTPTDNFIEETLKRYVTTPKFFSIRNMKVPTRKVSSFLPQRTGTQTLTVAGQGTRAGVRGAQQTLLI